MSGLHVVGNQIRNADDLPVRLVGVNRSSAEYTCTSDSGSVFEGPADEGEVKAMKSWNIRAVRVVLNEDCWLGINGANPALSGANYQKAIADYVNLLTQNNIAVIINLHFSAPGLELAKDQAVMPDADHSPAFWVSVAARFKDNSAVLFEPYNEPHPDKGNNSAAAWTCWRDGGTCPGVPFVAAGMQQLVNVIRSTGATNIIILTGNNWGSQLDRWLEYKPMDPLNQLVAGWHSYGDGLDCQDEACWNSTLASVLQQVPIVATEIGEVDCGHAYIDRVMTFLDQHGQGYLGWTWGPFSCTDDPALLTDWAGTPTQTYGQGFKDHLLTVS
jgi:endoglucanase